MVADKEGEPRKPDRPYTGQPGEGVVHRARQPVAPLAAGQNGRVCGSATAKPLLFTALRPWAHRCPVGVSCDAYLWTPDPWNSLGWLNRRFLNLTQKLSTRIVLGYSQVPLCHDLLMSCRQSAGAEFPFFRLEKGGRLVFRTRMYYPPATACKGLRCIKGYLLACRMLRKSPRPMG